MLPLVKRLGGSAWRGSRVKFLSLKFRRLTFRQVCYGRFRLIEDWPFLSLEYVEKTE